MYDYVVTGLDVDAVLGVECIPMNDNGLKVSCKHKTWGFFLAVKSSSNFFFLIPILLLHLKKLLN
jgi:hypothetical protein